MPVVVDSDVLIDLLRRVPAARAALLDTRRSGEAMWSVTPVRTEILRGVRPGEELATLSALNLLAWMDVDRDLADRAGHLGRPYVRSHQGIDAVDLLLAAAVERLSARLLTRNVRDFPMFPGLEPAY